MNTKTCRMILSFALLFLSASASAKADTVEVTFGTYVIERMGGNVAKVVNIGGMNFALTEIEGTGFPGCDLCPPGTVTSANYFDFLGSPSITYNGNTYTESGFQFDTVARASFSTGSFTLPFTNAPTFTISLPFTFTGDFRVFNPNPGGGLLLDHDLFGDGIVTLEYTTFDVGGTSRHFQLQRVTYDFAAPVPEPATLILFGSGVAGLALRARRRRRLRTLDRA